MNQISVTAISTIIGCTVAYFIMYEYSKVQANSLKILAVQHYDTKEIPENYSPKQKPAITPLQFSTSLDCGELDCRVCFTFGENTQICANVMKNEVCKK